VVFTKLHTLEITISAHGRHGHHLNRLSQRFGDGNEFSPLDITPLLVSCPSLVHLRIEPPAGHQELLTDLLLTWSDDLKLQSLQSARSGWPYWRPILRSVGEQFTSFELSQEIRDDALEMEYHLEQGVAVEIAGSLESFLPDRLTTLKLDQAEGGAQLRRALTDQLHVRLIGALPLIETLVITVSIDSLTDLLNVLPPSLTDLELSLAWPKEGNWQVEDDVSIMLSLLNTMEVVMRWLEDGKRNLRELSVACPSVLNCYKHDDTYIEVRMSRHCYDTNWDEVSERCVDLHATLERIAAERDMYSIDYPLGIFRDLHRLACAMWHE